MESGDDLTFDERDSAPYMPKARVADPGFDWEPNARRQSIPWDDTIIYEVHVKGLTKRHSLVPERCRGTYEGLGTPKVLKYIKSLGVTSIELLPVHKFVDDNHLLDKGLTKLLGLQHDWFFLHRIRVMPQPRRTACANSKTWWLAFTRLVLKSSSTSFTTHSGR